MSATINDDPASGSRRSVQSLYHVRICESVCLHVGLVRAYVISLGLRSCISKRLYAHPCYEGQWQ